MSASTIEDRVTHLESETSAVKLALLPANRPKNPWVTFGMMAGVEGYNEIVRLGAEYRQQERERVIEEAACGLPGGQA